MNEDPLALLPEIILAVAAVTGLLLGSYLPRQRQWPVRLLTALACAAAVVATVAVWNDPARTVFGDSYAIDVATNAGRVIVLVAVLLTLGVSAGEFRSSARESELYVLVLLAALGTIVLTGANDLLLLVAAYLLASIPLYAIAGFAKDDLGTEGALKFYLLGALLGITMLAGATVLFGVGGATTYADLQKSLGTAPTAAVAVGFVGVLAGLLFKMGAVPAHFWIPDVTEGTRPPAAAFLTTVPKIGGVVAAYRLVATAMSGSSVDWPLLVALIAAVTMTLGNLAAFFQRDVRRLLGYSTISQVGYLLMAVVVAGRSSLALPSMLLYLAAYAVTNLGAFAVVCALPQRKLIDEYRGLLRQRPWLAVSLVVCLLGLVGTPPTAVFAGKLAVFTAALDGGYGWLVVVAAVNTVASLFYYLRWIAPAVRSAEVQETTVVDRWAATTAYAATVVSLALGPISGLVLAAFRRDLTAM
ncbi:NADH-quinone oxidoreductase subunit N [Amycolatopsis sp. SID8362]|uniref:NADH-quinone oxidoreductase subunit N n=1 Tax=Amycolatopsis sp. SID8362 TaxID=2690346 RepID=UPI00136F60AB|nr:NADH-quinone oxidoreductase subunit N [Amycolatopsis sp. SID8362]NBH03442.1 NADH-quinone oxidoreductase subunit N [Amycolatopsis sp. SID8362]NED40142.1 NADH-quinone oxidoreductase subunit N [Amycolatopsis sp. SID8362]